MSGDKMCGGCLCGAVRYEIDGAPESVTHCHCTMCRKASGAPFVTWLAVRHENFRYTSGEPVSYRSSDIARRAFCASCGGQLQFDYHGATGHTHLSAGSLDEPANIAPERHIWVKDRIPWANNNDGLPEFPGED